jgi:hypothetical protein
MVTEQDKEPLHITVGCCISASGGHASTLLILPQKEFPLECEELLTDDTFVWAGQENGWMVRELFEQWVPKVFIPHVRQVRERFNFDANRPALLFLDSHDSRRSDKALEELVAAHIVVVTLPAHSSHVLQPLDCGVHAVFKHWITKLKNDRPVVHTDLPSRKRALVQLARQALHHALWEGTVISAFEKAGIRPFDLMNLNGNPFRNHLTNFSAVAALAPPKKRRSHVAIDKQVLTSPESIQRIREQRERKEAREALKVAREAKKARRSAGRAKKLPPASDPALVIPQGESDLDEPLHLEQRLEQGDEEQSISVNPK